ncbi:MAG: trigger factor, partial [Opitutales bacterium]
MNVTVTDVSELRKELIVSFSTDELVAEEKTVVGEFAKQARIPGFRPGKAPAELIRKRFKKGVSEELGKKVAARAYEFAVKDQDLKVYNVVDISRLEEIDTTQDLAIDITVDLAPDITLPDYTNLPTQAPSTEVSDEEVDEVIERIRRERADFQEVEREAAAGDYVKLTYTGKVDDQPIADLLEDQPAHKSWGSVENGWEEAGTEEAKQFGVPAVIDALVGLKAGDTRTVEQPFAEDFKIEALRGKTGSYEVTVREVRERVLPELDEDFIKSLQVESLEDLKGRILDDLENRKKQEAAEAQRKQIIDQLLDATQFSVPASAVEQETQTVMARVMMDNMRKGVPEE